MDRPISVGDLVQVVRAGCPCPEIEDTNIGKVFIVKALVFSYGKCADCGRSDPPCWCADDGIDLFPLRRLRRIPPLSELEGERTQEPVREEV